MAAKQVIVRYCLPDAGYDSMFFFRKNPSFNATFFAKKKKPGALLLFIGQCSLGLLQSPLPTMEFYNSGLEGKKMAVYAPTFLILQLEKLLHFHTAKA